MVEEERKLEKVLSKEKVINAIDMCEMYPSLSSQSSLENEIEKIVCQKINDLLFNFKQELEHCEPDAYPCALCFDAEGQRNF